MFVSTMFIILAIFGAVPFYVAVIFILRDFWVDALRMNVTGKDVDVSAVFSRKSKNSISNDKWNNRLYSYSSCKESNTTILFFIPLYE